MSTGPSPDNEKPTALGHLRVVELGDMPAAYCANYLGGLGADVIKVEPPGGDPNRRLPSFAGDIEDAERSLPFLNANLNKRSIVLDLVKEGDAAILADLLARADIFVESTPPGHLATLSFDEERLEGLNPGLVTVSLTPFGQWGPYSGYRGGDAIFSAMSGLLASQGDDTRAPLVPPNQISSQLAAIHGAYLALAAVRHRRRTGRGQRIDLSLQEALTYATGSFIARYSQRNEITTRQGIRGGAVNIRRCKDGRYANLAIFMTPHWHILTREWMEDPVLSQPEWDSAQYRTDNEDLAKFLIDQFAAQFDADEFIAEAQRRGLSCAPVNTLEEFVNSEHMRERSWFQQIEHPVVGTYLAPGPPVNLAKTPYRVRRPAPLLDQHRAEILAELKETPPRRETAIAPLDGVPADAPMLEGIRLADVTRVFVGPIGTMMLGFYGAEVIKVESADLFVNREPARPVYPDMNRNKLSCTIDLRHPEGKELFKSLAKVSDIVVDNFSATVMSRLGLGYEEIRKVKPDIIQIGMPGMGSTGPFKDWATYGNQLTGYCGLTHLWGHPESPMEAHAKGVIPDYAGAAFLALSSLAAIEYRDQTGEGQRIEVCMIDGQGALLGPAILEYTVNGRSLESVRYNEPMARNIAPFGAYPCKYADTWIVIACENDDDWRNLIQAMGEPTWATDPRFADRTGRREHQEELDANLADWTRNFTSHQMLRLLQKAGVPAGFTMNGEQAFYDLHLRARGHLVEVDQPPWGLTTHHGLPGIPSLSKASATGPTPMLGVDNADIFSRVLGLSPQEIAQKEASGAIH